MKVGKERKLNEENIFNLVPPDPEEIPKVKLHKSKFPGNLPPTGSTFGLHSTSAKVANLGGQQDEVVFGHNPYGDHSYWGPHLSGEANKVASDRRKGKYPFHLPVVSSSHHSPSPEVRKPLLPDIRNKPFFNVCSGTDHLQKNKEAAKFLTKSQSQARVIQKKTTKTLPPPPLKSGQIPHYLIKMKKERFEAEEQLKQEEEAREAKNKNLATTNLEYFELPTDDKESLLDNLKQKWSTLNSEYQTLIHRKDFRGTMKKRKETLEDELGVVEAYIKRLDRPMIFIKTTDVEEKVPKKNLRAYKSSIKL